MTHVPKDLGLSADEAWILTIADVLERGHESAPRGRKTRELLGVQTVVDMSLPVLTVKNRVDGVRFYDFMPAEAAWILSGENRVKTIAPYSKAISRFSDDGRYFAGAYGPKIIDQLTYVVDCLRHDPDSRQAVVNIWRENPRPTRDVPCTLSVQWLVRDGKIYCHDTMRSSDLWLGWPYDVFNFTMLTFYIALMIRERGGFVDRPDLPAMPRIGELRLTAASQHIYEPQWLKCRECLNHPEPLFAYQPLDPDEFKSPDELVEFLWSLADVNPAVGFDGRDDLEFMRELIEVKKESR